MRTVLLFSLCTAIGLLVAPAAEAKPKKVLRTVADATIPNGVAVYRQAGSRPKDYWCNAGDFALRKLSAPSGAALELVRPEGAPGGPSDRQSVGFSLVSGGGNSTGVSLSNVGERHSLAQTKAFCQSQVDPGDR